MRKRTVDYVSDNIFWYLIYFLPVLCYFLYLFAEPSSVATITNFADFFSLSGFSFVSDNVVFTSLTSIFGQGGILPLFASETPLLIFTWFICCFIGHLFVDFLLFIPRLCHKWLKTFTLGE